MYSAGYSLRIKDDDVVGVCPLVEAGVIDVC
jgi:hypothetical protein